MRYYVLIILLLLGTCFPASADTRIGFFLSLGQMHYNYKNFDGQNTTRNIDQNSDFFLGASLRIPNQLEINLVYNRAIEETVSSAGRVAYDRDGFGLEAGKVISMHLFRKNKFAVSADVVGGFFYFYYPKPNIRPILTNYEELPQIDQTSNYQTGFYWAVRIKYRIAQKASFDVGFKSLLPVANGRLPLKNDKKLFLFKSFFTIGISF